MTPPTRFPSRGWLLATATAVGLAVLTAAPPVLGAEAGAVVRHAFAVVCHQLPERTLHFDGAPLALCHRCMGMLLGLALGLLATPALGANRCGTLARSAQAPWLVGAAVPTALDWLAGAAGVWANTPSSRTLTGLLFGLVAGGILAANLLSAPRRGTPALTPSPS